MAQLPNGDVDLGFNADANTGNWQPPTQLVDSSGRDVAKSNRMAQNLAAGVGPNAAPQQQQLVNVRIGENARENEDKDWRVSLSVPDLLKESNIFAPFAELGKLVFPFTPTILLGSSANYSAIQPIHTNHPFYAYENSQVDQITVTGELRLNGYGKHVLNNIPVVITNFTTDLPQDVDYIECEVNGEINFVPTQSIFTVTVQPQYARRSHSRFSLNEFINGTTVGAPEGFV
jgi:hypothetical protein